MRASQKMKIYFYLVTCLTANAFTPTTEVSRRHISPPSSANNEEVSSRRIAIRDISLATLFLFGLAPFPASARKTEEFIKIGTQTPAREGEAEFIQLPNGVKIKDYRIGTGDDSVKENSQVMIQATGRLLNFNGFVFYSTKNNNPDGFGAVPLTINLGKGEALPGLEAGLVGMKKGGIRRILIPAELAYSKSRNLEPRPMSSNDQRALDSVVKNPNMDATVLFDVSLERCK
jgi:hypothetical protein